MACGWLPQLLCSLPFWHSRPCPRPSIQVFSAAGAFPTGKLRGVGKDEKTCFHAPKEPSCFALGSVMTSCHVVVLYFTKAIQGFTRKRKGLSLMYDSHIYPGTTTLFFKCCFTNSTMLGLILDEKKGSGLRRKRSSVDSPNWKEGPVDRVQTGLSTPSSSCSIDPVNEMNTLLLLLLPT